jgi:hypothetical protein
MDDKIACDKQEACPLRGHFGICYFEKFDDCHHYNITHQLTFPLKRTKRGNKLDMF